MGCWMKEQQIVASYRDARDRPLQVRILADLNDTTEKEITAILERNGYTVEKEAKRAYRCARNEKWKEWTEAEDARVIAMHNRGMSSREIAAITDRTTFSVQARLGELRRRGVKLVYNQRGRKSGKHTV